MSSGAGSVVPALEDCLGIGGRRVLHLDGDLPPAVELVDDRAALQDGLLLHRLGIERTQPFRVRLPSALWSVRLVAGEVHHRTWIVRNESLVRRTKYSRKLYELKDCEVRRLVWYKFRMAWRVESRDGGHDGEEPETPASATNALSASVFARVI